MARSSAAEDLAGALPSPGGGPGDRRLVSPPADASRFVREFKQLYEQAGRPPLQTVQHDAAQQKPPLKVSISSLSDWFRGVTMPADPSAVRFLVDYLRRRAKGAVVAPTEAWLTWYEQARAEARSRRGTRRARGLAPVDLPASPMRDLRDALLFLYRRAGAPSLAELSARIRDNDALPGTPSRDTIHRIITGRVMPSRADAVTLAAVLATTGEVDLPDAVRNIGDLWSAASSPASGSLSTRVGKPVGDWDPLLLGVHPVAESAEGEGLPPYIAREHDDRLRGIVEQAIAAGDNAFVVLAGASSTGKTRSLWEAARHLDQENPGRWRVWYPYDPTRPEAAAEGVGRVGPHTVVWLDDVHAYLRPADPALGEQVAAGLRTLLTGAGRGPVLVFGSVWREQWTDLATRPPAHEPDRYAQARHLLTVAHRIDVPDQFSPYELEAAMIAADPRLRYAAERAGDGRITQYLAGAATLVQRYRLAPPPVRAVLDTAVDARRLGHPETLPYRLFEQAAPGYLDDFEWERLGDDWLESALREAGTPGAGTSGPLVRVRERPSGARVSEQPVFRLADFVEQIGRTERAGLLPPSSFWAAVLVSVRDPDVLQEMCRRARRLDGIDGQTLERLAEAAATTSLNSEISVAVEQAPTDRLALYFQPIMDLRTGRAASHEVLLRVRDGNGVPLSPAAVLEAAEDRDEVLAIDLWVTERAIRLAAGQPGMRLQINLSGRSIGEPRLADEVERLVRESGVNPEQLTFEITETALIGNFDAARRSAERIRELGCHLALDDFGSGYASFRYLRLFPLDLVKIDGEYIVDLVDNPQDQVLVRALVQVCQAYGIQTVAEFVQDEATLRMLRELGVDYAQGYFVGRPAPAIEPAASRGPAEDRAGAALGGEAS
ncbi:hypothetical protein GCM10010168_93360 [Actinoplanes ianthinogenes]|uniref:EAL domain-containing protein n=1 Tax=Actinoplanes ianthinogenes TaxID=122358 RepID=A0ABM7LKK3_9ACTN|nr:EAL domain-containing protein [Actinoplanes ianthinogenes]BCJ39791.1 hypothetical protein Aiant_04480 [Actinoplanes ianthinogenes]GGR59903.1 hypothetical protein GCM10010168_93360 [Actinoplanes ianthinogenes]